VKQENKVIVEKYKKVWFPTTEKKINKVKKPKKVEKDEKNRDLVNKESKTKKKYLLQRLSKCYVITIIKKLIEFNFYTPILDVYPIKLCKYLWGYKFELFI
jgi:hypothetical protein